MKSTKHISNLHKKKINKGWQHLRSNFPVLLNHVIPLHEKQRNLYTLSARHFKCGEKAGCVGMTF